MSTRATTHAVFALVKEDISNALVTLFLGGELSKVDALLRNAEDGIVRARQELNELLAAAPQGAGAGAPKEEGTRK